MYQLDGLSPRKFSQPRRKKQRRWFVGLLIFVLITVDYLLISSWWFFLYNKFDSLKYLILFQNNSELRPTGGFIGSFALAEIGLTGVKDIKVNTNIYKLDDKYDYILRLEAPQPLKTILGEKYWAMRDANWSPDFPTSAEKVAWFYQQEGGRAVDGVMAIDASLVADLLAITGPIELPQHQVTISSENFFEILHWKIEKEYFLNPANKAIDEPKTILKDLLPPLLERIKKKENRRAIVNLIWQASREKHLLLYFYNPLWEKLVQLVGLGGEIKQNKQFDYLAVNHANLGGQKSSLNITQQTQLNVFVAEDGKVKNNLLITRTHQGNGQWPDADNQGYIRILLPQDAKLIKAELDGREITSTVEVSEEKQKTVFGFWFNTPAGQKKILSISYQLADRLTNLFDYSLFWQKQPGVISEELKVVVNDQVLYQGVLATDLLLP